ncbi:MAG: hypothetical protein ACI9OJ_000736, partial [Myxococcota bacterium]
MLQKTVKSIVLALVATCTFWSQAMAQNGAQDVVVWETTAKGYKSSWVVVDGDSVRTIATREEAVISDGTRLWAARISTRSIPMYPCEMLDDENLKAKPDGHFDYPSLSLLELTGEAKAKVLEGWGKDTYFGEVWSNKIRLTGSFGPHLLIDHVDTSYTCGAHGSDDSKMFVYNAVSGSAPAAETFIKDLAKANREAVPELLEEVKAEECYEEEMSENSIFIDGLTISANKGEIFAAATYLHPTGASWAFNCTISNDHILAEDEMTPQVAASVAAKAALKTLKFKGDVGYSNVNLKGPARAAALAAFKTKS